MWFIYKVVYGCLTPVPGAKAAAAISTGEGDTASNDAFLKSSTPFSHVPAISTNQTL